MKTDRYNFVVSYGGYTYKRMEFGTISVTLDENEVKGVSRPRKEHKSISAAHTLYPDYESLLNASQEQTLSEESDAIKAYEQAANRQGDDSESDAEVLPPPGYEPETIVGLPPPGPGRVPYRADPISIPNVVVKPSNNRNTGSFLSRLVESQKTAPRDEETLSVTSARTTGSLTPEERIEYWRIYRSRGKAAADFYKKRIEDNPG
ncbi:hypothetical protein 3 [Wenzhou tombus-like virus 6]|uniref:hypothetical protein 3 n=1 Tax=Wenzhou tombus-like virus 6 TaxID=1923676 RepID=UPI00090C1DB8|nr:hypothetical protein 3 [Wenzhou tombus-like virus 6]APG76603.1 hypothetical protein 3 [Wenzhou tombus-like virus 6]